MEHVSDAYMLRFKAIHLVIRKSVFVTFWSFEKITPNCSIASVGNSDSQYEISIYELSPGLSVFLPYFTFLPFSLLLDVILIRTFDTQEFINIIFQE
jgi:hypothetical protein